MTAPTEPVTLEEAIQLLGPDEGLLVGHSGWEGMQYSVVEERSVKFLTHTYGKWEDALTDRLDRKVVARDDAAELRAVVRLSARLLEWLSSREGTAPEDAREAEEVVRRARAALAATEGSEP